MFPYSSIPRPEYPRPDRQRGRAEGVDWLNLNGPWQFRFDPARRGQDVAWFATGGPEWREQILVPFCWESLAAWGAGNAAGNDNYFSTRVYLNPLEVTRENHRAAQRHEVGWYRRWVAIPATPLWRSRRTILTIGAADFFTDCWCNGHHVGHHEGGYDPIEIDLTDALKASDPDGRALLVIRVEDPMDNREQPVGKQWGWYTTPSGIWQTVFLEPRSATNIRRFTVVPDIDSGRADFTVYCDNVDSAASLTVDIMPPDAPPLSLSLEIVDNVARGSVDLEPVALWDPGDPKLYRTVYRLHDGERETDVVHGYFGMRKIGTRAVDSGSPTPPMLSLNNKPIYLRGALYQSYYPDGVYTAGDASVLRNDIIYAREVGFDFLRIHIKLDDPLLLYYADTLGILLMQDFPNFGEGGDTALGRRRFESMMRAGIERDFNHPSIIAWCLFNETWGFGGQTELMKLIGPAAKAGKITPAEIQKIANQDSFRWVHQMWELAKSLDPTRLIEDMSVVVWEHLAAYGHVDTDVNSWHFYLDDYAKARAHIENVVAKTYKGSTFNYVEGYEQRDVPLINSEYGGVGALDGDRDVSWSFKFLTNELRRHRQLSAYIFTELHDVEWEYNGFLNYDRTPKQFGYPPSIINQGDVLPIDAAPIRLCKPGESIEIDVLSSHFSRRERSNVALQWTLTGMDTLGVVHAELARGRAPIPFRHHRVELARRLRLTMPDARMLCTLLVSAVTPDGATVAANFVQQFVADGPAPDREDHGHRLVLRRRVREWTSAEWSGGATPATDERLAGICAGSGHGFFEWEFRDDMLRSLARARRVRVLCEVSAHRGDTSQTDSHRFPTQFELLLNDVPVHRALLPNHPHDTRGSLTYLNGGKGAYGYLMQATIEDDHLRHVASTASDSGLGRFRCAGPSDRPPHGGLTVYCHDWGRYPVGPTVIVEWEWDQA